jgi:predicted component of type VI protein secretion system
MALQSEFDDVTQGERELLELYERLNAILERHGDELPPFAQRNAVKALAALWQVANGLGAQPGQVYDVGA